MGKASNASKRLQMLRQFPTAFEGSDTIAVPNVLALLVQEDRY